MNVYKVFISFDFENGLEKYNSVMILVWMYTKWWFSKRGFESVRGGKCFRLWSSNWELYLPEVVMGISYPYEGKTVLTIDK